jgi:hypothetical protein
MTISPLFTLLDTSASGSGDAQTRAATHPGLHGSCEGTWPHGRSVTGAREMK